MSQFSFLFCWWVVSFFSLVLFCHSLMLVGSTFSSRLLIGSTIDGVPCTLFSSLLHSLFLPFFSGSLGTRFPFTSILQEKLIAKDVVAWRLGCFLHMLNLFLMLLIPILVINVKSDHIGVLGATVVTLTYSILFLKLWSYVQVAKDCRFNKILPFNQVNHWCRCSATILGPGEKRARWVLQNSGLNISSQLSMQ